ncbi:Uncharacterised protein [Psychrobacter phenylpyruvicus]|uniref:Uncharacterized protein n=1 Tax=Psychrobacter phenylpyruvicus TaxID=29432 RepID=A0A379LLE4_9GAMM|nr:Uncharacterised protein [Psychrobacter phenylpyruvicus]
MKYPKQVRKYLYLQANLLKSPKFRDTDLVAGVMAIYDDSIKNKRF